MGVGRKKLTESTGSAEVNLVTFAILYWEKQFRRSEEFNS